MIATAKAPWLAHREWGNRSATRLMSWFALRCGRQLTRFLLYPICAYFLLFSPRARTTSRRYLACALGRRARLIDLWRHYFAFAATVLDRVYFIEGRFDGFEIEFKRSERFEKTLSRGRGCLLLGAHLGSFELLRAIGSVHRLSVNVVMYEDNAANITEVLNDQLDPAVRERVIVPGRMDTVLRISECFARGETVAMLGDRVAGSSDKTVVCRFFGRDAVFPQGPLLLALRLGVPVYLFAGLYEGGKRYVVHLEPFCEQPEAGRAERAAWAREWTQRYADRIEHFCRLAPYNWFNFYHFWSEPPA